MDQITKTIDKEFQHQQNNMEKDIEDMVTVLMNEKVDNESAQDITVKSEINIESKFSVGIDEDIKNEIDGVINE